MIDLQILNTDNDTILYHILRREVVFSLVLCDISVGGDSQNDVIDASL